MWAPTGRRDRKAKPAQPVCQVRRGRQALTGPQGRKETSAPPDRPGCRERGASQDPRGRPELKGRRAIRGKLGLQDWQDQRSLLRPVARMCLVAAAVAIAIAALRPAPLILVILLVVVFMGPWTFAVVRRATTEPRLP